MPNELDVLLHFAAYAKATESVRILENREKYLPDPIRQRQINQLKDFADTMLLFAYSWMNDLRKHTSNGIAINDEIEKLLEQFALECPINNYNTGEYVRSFVVM